MRNLVERGEAEDLREDPPRDADRGEVRRHDRRDEHERCDEAAQQR